MLFSYAPAHAPVRERGTVVQVPTYRAARPAYDTYGGRGRCSFSSILPTPNPRAVHVPTCACTSITLSMATTTNAQNRPDETPPRICHAHERYAVAGALPTRLPTRLPAPKLPSTLAWFEVLPPYPIATLRTAPQHLCFSARLVQPAQGLPGGARWDVGAWLCVGA